LDWLRADLAAWRKALEQGAAPAPAAEKVLQQWLADPAFDGVRGERALVRLPEAERRDWQRLWEQVEALRRQAAGEPRRPKGPGGS
jgi:hypothetical protein